MLTEYFSNLDVALLLFTTAYLIRLLFESFETIEGYDIFSRSGNHSGNHSGNKEKKSLLNQSVVFAQRRVSEKARIAV